MASHVDPKVNDDFIEWTRQMYEHEGIGKVSVTRGKVHDYLAMQFNFDDKGVVKIKMRKYIQKIEEFTYKDKLPKKNAETTTLSF